jgi:hypothetical protein
MYNKKSLKNLKKFSSENQPKKNGRPKGLLSLTREIKKVLETVDPTSRKPILELLAIAAKKQAMKGNLAYFKEIIKRVDNKVPDKTEHTDKDSGPVTIRVVCDALEKVDDFGKN